MALPDIIGEGNMTADPELKTVGSGKSVCTITVACTERRKNDNGEWEDGDQAFVRVEVWNEEAERLASWGYRGCAVIYRGKLRVRDYESNGQKGRSVECKFAKVAPDPARNTITVQKAQRQQQSNGQQQSSGRAWGGSGGNGGNQPGKGWGRTSGSSQGRTGGDPWAPVPAGQSAEPPF